MKSEKLYAGLVFKNYIEMSKELEIKFASGGNQRNYHFKELARYCEYEKVGQKIVIKKVHEHPKQKIDNRGKTSSINRLKYPIYIHNPKLASQWLTEENGMELPTTLGRTSEKEFWWLCPDCNHKIFSSPMNRFNKNKEYTDEYITCPYCSLSKGAKKIYDFLYYNKIQFKLEYKFDDLIGIGKRKLRFDFALFDENNKLISLIEFDGGYHDKELNPDENNYNIISTHDKLKNEYCIKNNISLLRIHHSDVNNIFNILSNYLLNIGISETIIETIKSNQNKYLLDSIEIYEKKKEILEKELQKINKQINDLKLMIN